MKPFRAREKVSSRLSFRDGPRGPQLWGPGRARARARARAKYPRAHGELKNFKGNFENDQDKKSSARPELQLCKIWAKSMLMLRSSDHPKIPCLIIPAFFRGYSHIAEPTWSQNRSKRAESSEKAQRFTSYSWFHYGTCSKQIKPQIDDLRPPILKFVLNFSSTPFLVALILAQTTP